jgi:hypothetical protein
MLALSLASLFVFVRYRHPMNDYASGFVGRGELADRQQRLGCLLAKIKKVDAA